ncbi:MAG: alpha-glucosidase/alpha-galactosidase, partial [Opitutales bacterium]|nr:alpha-glucosidase/alpha-galactosidase [Opitutales bacterium]
MPKVVIIGARSLVFSRRLQADILSFENLRNTHFCLVEIDEERLGYAQPITEQLLKTGVYPEATFEATTERRTVLAGADYVISSLLVGGYEAIEAEIDIPKKYGVDQCISDTLTP